MARDFGEVDWQDREDVLALIVEMHRDESWEVDAEAFGNFASEMGLSNPELVDLVSQAQVQLDRIGR